MQDNLCVKEQTMVHFLTRIQTFHRLSSLRSIPEGSGCGPQCVTVCPAQRRPSWAPLSPSGSSPAAPRPDWQLPSLGLWSAPSPRTFVSQWSGSSWRKSAHSPPTLLRRNAVEHKVSRLWFKQTACQQHVYSSSGGDRRSPWCIGQHIGVPSPCPSISAHTSKTRLGAFSERIQKMNITHDSPRGCPVQYFFHAWLSRWKVLILQSKGWIALEGFLHDRCILLRVTSERTIWLQHQDTFYTPSIKYLKCRGLYIRPWKAHPTSDTADMQSWPVFSRVSSWLLQTHTEVIKLL